MFVLNVHNRLRSMMSVFRLTRLWRDDESDAHQLGRNILQLTLFLHYFTSTLIMARISNNADERRFFLAASIIIVNVTVRMYYILWKKKEIIELTNRIGAGFFKNRETFNRANERTNLFMKFATGMLVMNYSSNVALIIFKLPFFGAKRQLPVNLYFPFDWEASEFYFWAAYAFVTYEMILCATCTLLNTIIWYLMMWLAIKYQALGGDFRTMGVFNTDDVTPKRFEEELSALIEQHKDLQQTTDSFKKCFANLFFIQITTSGVGICFSIYLLVFNSEENSLLNYLLYMIVLVYNLFDIFMVLWLGNEITLSSERLLYSLFESNWIDQSHAYKKYMHMLMIFFEKPQLLIIGKLFPLTFDTFTSIINFAYTLFNVLKNVK